MQYKLRKAMEELIYIYLFVLLVISPYYMIDKYSKLGRAKFELFRNSSLLLLGLMILLLLVYLLVSARDIKWSNLKLSMPDKFVLLYFAATLLSFALSSYKSDAFWGIRGWSMGLFSQGVFILIYFFISRFLEHEYPVLLMGGIATTGVFLLGILHRFLIDPFGLYEGLDENLRIQFLSTLGQATWYSSFLCVCFPVAMGIYWFARNRMMKLFSGLYIAVAMASVVTQNSDSAFFALGAVCLVLFCLSFQNRKKMLRFLELCLIILISFQFMGILRQIYWYRAVELEKLSIFLSESIQMKILLVVFLALYIFLRIYKNIDLTEWTFIRNAVLIVIGMALIGTILFIYCNTTDILYDKFGYRNEANYLRFDDSWGNGRGSSWKLAWKVFGEMSIQDKLFGVGPDCFSKYVYGNPVYAQILQEKWGNSNLINVHNEFFNSMICYGLFGVISYIGIFVAAFVRFIDKNSPIILGAALCIVAYAGHNFFCYQQVLCTPYLFIVLGMGEAFVRKLKKKQNILR